VAGPDGERFLVNTLTQASERRPVLRFVLNLRAGIGASQWPPSEPAGDHRAVAYQR